MNEERQVKVKGKNGDTTGTICAVNVIQSAKAMDGKKQKFCAVCILKNDLAAMNICDGTDHQISEIPTGVIVRTSKTEGFCKYGDLLYSCKKS